MVAFLWPTALRSTRITLKQQPCGIQSSILLGKASGSVVGVAILDSVLTGHRLDHSMVTSTDIPDWCYYETLAIPYHWNEYRPPTKDELEAMYECSPVRRIDSVKTPTLVALGLSDLRVPPSQGLEWYHSLRSKGVPAKLLTYDDDDHAIAGVLSEADHWINIKQWFDKHLQ